MVKDRTGQVWEVARLPWMYLVISAGFADGFPGRTLHRVADLTSGALAHLQELDGDEWEISQYMTRVE